MLTAWNRFELPLGATTTFRGVKMVLDLPEMRNGLNIVVKIWVKCVECFFGERVNVDLALRRWKDLEQMSQSIRGSIGLG